MYLVAETAGAFLEEQKEPVAIGVRKKDVLTTIATQDVVIQAAREIDAVIGCHEAFIGTKL